MSSLFDFFFFTVGSTDIINMSRIIHNLPINTDRGTYVKNGKIPDDTG